MLNLLAVSSRFTNNSGPETSQEFLMNGLNNIQGVEYDIDIQDGESIPHQDRIINPRICCRLNAMPAFHQSQ
jgi:hypothetical protein